MSGFSFDTSDGGTGSGLSFDSSVWDSTATGIGADNSYLTDRTADYVPTDAIGSMTPVATAPASEWGGFWRDTLKGVIGYQLTKDAVQSGVRSPAPAGYTSTGAPLYARQPAYAPAQQGNLLILLGLGALAVFALKG